ncbi:MAG: PAS domain-containing protein [Butyrivibrio sp.]|nr:PAS domain-containing protein [Butyrivibrio sp.]
MIEYQQAENVNRSFTDRVLRDMRNAVVILNESGKVLYLNQAAEHILNTRNEQFLSPALSEDADPRNDDFFQCIFDAIEHGDEVNQKHVRYFNDDGQEYHLHVTCSRLEGEKEDEGGFVLTMCDETRADTLAQKRRDATIVLISVIVMIGIWIFVYALYEALGRPFDVTYLSRFTELMAIILFVIALKETSFTTKEMGLKSDNLKKDLGQGGLVALVLVGLMAGIKLSIMHKNPDAYAGKPFIDLSVLGLRTLRYVFVALLQEFLARCVMQENLTRILDGKYRDYISLAISTLIFMVLHVHRGLLYMIGAAVLMGSLGLLYKRQRNIWGTFLAHFCFGTFGDIFGFG